MSVSCTFRSGRCIGEVGLRAFQLGRCMGEVGLCIFQSGREHGRSLTGQARLNGHWAAQLTLNVPSSYSQEPAPEHAVDALTQSHVGVGPQSGSTVSQVMSVGHPALPPALLLPHSVIET